ncbi:MAG TPA: hypothetical protein DEG71_02510 [Clostridiales bacterium]|nr:hypothetical protein [Clostridiales bacterium]
MNNINQDIIVSLILALTFVYIVYKVIKRFNSKSKGNKECSDCSDCPIKKECDNVKK